MECHAIDWSGVAFVEPAPLKPVPKVADIILAAAWVYEISVEDILSDCRRFAFAHPRQLAQYMAREITGNSYPQLGRVFSRDHSSVLFAHRKMAAMIAAGDAKVISGVARINDELARGDLKQRIKARDAANVAAAARKAKQKIANERRRQCGFVVVEMGA